jgi:hypothetical protein
MRDFRVPIPLIVKDKLGRNHILHQELRNRQNLNGDNPYKEFHRTLVELPRISIRRDLTTYQGQIIHHNMAHTIPTHRQDRVNMIQNTGVKIFMGGAILLSNHLILNQIILARSFLREQKSGHPL